MPVVISIDSGGPWPLIVCDQCQNHVYRQGIVLYRSLTKTVHTTQYYTFCGPPCVHEFIRPQAPYPAWQIMTLETFIRDLMFHSGFAHKE